MLFTLKLHKTSFNCLLITYFVPDGESANIVDVITLNATDADTGDNSRIQYSLITPMPGFIIGQYDGILRVNLSNLSMPLHDNQLTVKATDFGKPNLSSCATIRIKANRILGQSASPYNDYKCVF